MDSFYRSFIQFIGVFINPITFVFSSIGICIPFIVGAFKNPAGAVNTWICKMIDIVVSVLPSTPNNLKIGSLIDSIADKIPLFGQGIVQDIFQSIFAMFSIIVLIKLYKLIPFKAT